MEDTIAELMNRNYGTQKEYPSRRVIEEFICDNVDILTVEESIEVLKFIVSTQGPDGIADVSEGVALNVTKLQLFVLQSVYDMFLKYKEIAESDMPTSFE